MLIKTFGSAIQGIHATKITIEVNISQGIRFFIVGLADHSIRESQQRIETAISKSRQCYSKLRPENLLLIATRWSGHGLGHGLIDPCTSGNPHLPLLGVPPTAASALAHGLHLPK